MNGCVPASSADTTPLGLTGAEADRRLRELGPPADTSSRSTRSIVFANVFTLFNAIIAVFFVLVISQGLFADALFGLIAIVNSGIGIRQELKAKEVLDNLALLVAPRAKVVRDGSVLELLATEVVPGDTIRIEPGDQLVADGSVSSSRGLTIDESLLTGEADGIRKDHGDQVLSGSFCTSGSGYFEVEAVREDSYAEKIAGEAKEFRHPPSPLQTEVNSVLWATSASAGPDGDRDAHRPQPAQRRVHRGRPAGDRRPDHARPRGPGPADERHPRGRGGTARAPEHADPADVGDRVAGRRRHDLRRQDRHAHRRHAEADRRDRPRGLGGRRAPRPGPLRSLRRRAQPDPGDDRRRLPGRGAADQRRGALLLEVEVERPGARRRRRAAAT